jgi:hypothetical protein
MPEPTEPGAPAAPDLDPAPAPPQHDDRAAQIAAVIRNGLSNGPIAQSQSTWDHLQTRLGEIARAIVKEL